MRPILVLSAMLMLAVLGAALGGPPSARAQRDGAFTIAAAHSLKEPLRQLLPLFEAQHPNVTIRVVYGPSQTLRKQIEEGAPVDVFMPSSLDEIDRLEKGGLVLMGSRRVYATTDLVVITGGAVPAPLTSVQDLTLPLVRRIAVGDPTTSSVGTFAMEFLKNARLDQQVGKRLVHAAHSQAVLDLVTSGEAEAGIVYRTDAERHRGVRIVGTVPADRHHPILYGMAAVWTAHPRGATIAETFNAFLLSVQAQDVLKQHGFQPYLGASRPQR